MKLPIKHKYFEDIKNGNKWVEYRAAHITFVDEKTGKKLRRRVLNVGVKSMEFLPLDLQKKPFFLKGENVMLFYLGDGP